jgi:hypothetical protein
VKTFFKYAMTILFFAGGAAGLVFIILHRVAGEFLSSRFGISDSFVAVVLLEEVIIYLAVERYTLFEPAAEGIGEIGRRLSGVQALYHSTQGETYAAIVAAIEEVAKGPEDKRRILLAALYGSRQKRPDGKTDQDPAVVAFDRRLRRAVTRERFTIKELFNITNLSRLERILGVLEQREDAPDSEAKAFSLPHALPLLSPLVIGDHFFLSLEDPKLTRVGASIHLRGPEYETFAEHYFEDLWEDDRGGYLRRATGMDREGIEDLRKAIVALEGVQGLVGRGST